MTIFSCPAQIIMRHNEKSRDFKHSCGNRLRMRGVTTRIHSIGVVSVIESIM